MLKQPNIELTKYKKFLLSAIRFAVKATGQSDPYLQGMCNGMLYVKALIDGKEPKYKKLKKSKPVSCEAVPIPANTVSNPKKGSSLGSWDWHNEHVKRCLPETSTEDTEFTEGKVKKGGVNKKPSGPPPPPPKGHKR